MPSGSVIVIRFDGVDITSKILPGSFNFQSQLNAVPGLWEYTVKDVDHDMSFVTGKESTLEVDGTLLVGGYCLQVGRTYPFPAMDTVTKDPQDLARYWKIRGVDYNRLFDYRILRNAADYLKRIPDFPKTTMDGALIRQMWSTYLDKPSGFDTDTFVDDIDPPFDPDDPATNVGSWMEQGTKARDQMADFTQFTGALWYFDAAKNLHHHAIEDSVMRWGFSDQPNYDAITASPVEFQGSTIGFREIDATEAGDRMVNDALIWGGSPFGSKSGVIFSREQNATSETDHGRWQMSEQHFGEKGYFNTTGTDKRANVIVNGSPGAVGADQNRGLKYPQWSFKFVWFAHLVPQISGVVNHLRPGFLSQIELNTFGPPGDPLIQLLPCRTMTITIPTLDPTGKGYVKFEGTFGLSPDDPFTLWRFLLGQKKIPSVTPPVVTDDVPGAPDPGSPPPGSQGQYTLTPAPNGSATVFTAPYSYISSSTKLYLYHPGVPGGVLLRRGVDYTESDPSAGQVTMLSTLPSGDTLRMDFLILSVVTGTSTLVTSIAAMKTAMLNDSIGEVVVQDGTYSFNPSTDGDDPDSLWISGPSSGGAYGNLASRTNPLIVRSQTPGGVIFDGGGQTGPGLTFLEGAHDQTWDGFVFDNFVPDHAAAVVFGAFGPQPPPHHITLRNITVDAGVHRTSSSSQLEHAFYFAHAVGDGPHHILMEDITINATHSTLHIWGAIHAFHPDTGVDPSNTVASHDVTIRRLTINGSSMGLVLWWMTRTNGWYIEDATITNAFEYAVLYQQIQQPADTVVLKNITSTGSGTAGFRSDITPPTGLTQINCSLA